MPDRIAALKELAQRATPGPWDVVDGNRVSVTLPCPPVEQCGYDSVCVALTYPDRRHNHVANAAFIAACDPSTILKLVAVVESARRWESKPSAHALRAFRSALSALDDREPA